MIREIMDVPFPLASCSPLINCNCTAPAQQVRRRGHASGALSGKAGGATRTRLIFHISMLSSSVGWAAMASGPAREENEERARARDAQNVYK
jgi:hypothetical protein